MPKFTAIPTTVVIKVTLVTFPEHVLTCALIDTGSQITLVNRAFLKWQPNPEKFVATGITDKGILISEYYPNLNIILGSKVVKAIVVYPSMIDKYDVILGNDFIQLFQSYTQAFHNVTFKTICGHYIRIPREYKPIRVRPQKCGEITQIKDADLKNWNEYYELTIALSKLTSVNCCTSIQHVFANQVSLETIKSKLKECYSDNPIKTWYKDRTICTIELKDPNEIIRVKRMDYNEQSRNEFKTQIQELLDLKLIRPSRSQHSSPAFMVMNEAEKRRNKARMVINYKKLNDATIFDGYFIPDTNCLLQLAQGKKYFSKFDCKSGFWQIKMAEKSIPLTAFSAPNGHYEWLVMPFGLKMPLRYSNDVWIMFLDHTRNIC